MKIKPQKVIDDKHGKIVFKEGKRYNRLSIGMHDIWNDYYLAEEFSAEDVPVKAKLE